MPNYIKYLGTLMVETRGSARRIGREVSLTACVQNWSHNLPEDHGKSISLFCGANGAPTVKNSTLTGNYSTPMGTYMLSKGSKGHQVKMSQDLDHCTNGTPTVKGHALMVVVGVLMVKLAP